MHGVREKDPVIPWALTLSDRRLLRAIRIGLNSDDIEQVRQEDERRWKLD